MKKFLSCILSILILSVSSICCTFASSKIPNYPKKLFILYDGHNKYWENGHDNRGAGDTAFNYIFYNEIIKNVENFLATDNSSYFSASYKNGKLPDTAYYQIVNDCLNSIQDIIVDLTYEVDLTYRGNLVFSVLPRAIADCIISAVLKPMSYGETEDIKNKLLSEDFILPGCKLLDDKSIENFYNEFMKLDFDDIKFKSQLENKDAEELLKKFYNYCYEQGAPFGSALLEEPIPCPWAAVLPQGEGNQTYYENSVETNPSFNVSSNSTQEHDNSKGNSSSSYNAGAQSYYENYVEADPSFNVSSNSTQEHDNSKGNSSSSYNAGVQSYYENSVGANLSFNVSDNSTKEHDNSKGNSTCSNVSDNSTKEHDNNKGNSTCSIV